MVAACTRPSKPTSPGCCDKSTAGDAGDAALDARAPIDAGAPKPSSRFRREEGCARDFSATGDAVQDIAELQRLCAQGLVAFFPNAVNASASGSEALEVPFRVNAPTACLRAGVVGGAKGVTASLVDERGAVLASTSSLEPLALVPVDGTVCVREPGMYRVVVRMNTGLEAQAVSVQAWQANP